MSEINKRLPYWEHLLIYVDEVDIEAAAWGWKPRDDFEERDLEAHKVALRRIDGPKRQGTYDLERRRMSKLIGPSPMCGLEIPTHVLSFNKLWSKLSRGARSPDHEQRKNFKAILDWIHRDYGDETPRETAEKIPLVEILSLLAEPKERPGRPPICPPWRNEVAALDRMRLLVPACADIGDADIGDAARLVATEEGKINWQNRAKTFAKHYRARVALRI